MNQKGSRNSKKLSRHGKENQKARPKISVSATGSLPAERFTKHPSDSHQTISSPQPLPSRWQYSQWSCFNRGFFWGGLVSLTSILSAIGGMALTKIDVVEQQIANQLSGSQIKLLTEERSNLNTLRQILLVEVEPDADSLVGFSKNASGSSKTVLLLKLDPELNLAQAINIPTDTQTEIAGFGTGTIADAYRIGGIDLLSQAINQLSDDIAIDRYLRTTPEVLRQLTASGRITLKPCDQRIRDCRDRVEQVARQSTAFETIRQRFNIPTYLASFETAIASLEPQLDTNILESEIISVAHFIKELEPERLRVDLIPGYVSSRQPESKDLAAKSSFSRPNSQLARDLNPSLARENPFGDRPIAVQNTTNNPELGQRVVAYLRHRNFRNVYLVKHIPLKLEQTKIVTNYGEVETASYLKNILGFGSLESNLAQPEPELILQLGKDAIYLPIDSRSY